MQPQDTPTAFLFKLWPWIEANRNRLIVGTGIVIAAIFLYSFFSWQREQKEITAGSGVTQLALALPPNANESQWADSYLKIANEHPDTLAGRRAWLQGAAALFAAGKYADAQTQFQKFLDAHPDGEFSASAALGVAASLEALGKLDLAVGAYQRVANGFSTHVVEGNAAKFALARIDGQQGKLTDALNFYESIVRSSPGSPLAQQATLRAVELKTKLTPAKPAAVEP
ncbi:MAG: tetratricopeptide repeat protein [Verrucomicrobiota bacterium]|jgi:predicted negative regulator of RcsB-dependent stress response